MRASNIARTVLVSASVTSTLLSVPAFFAGCNRDAQVVVENDACINEGDGYVATKDARTDQNGESVTANDASAGVCVPNGITFNLSVGTTDNVWFGGSTPPWPAASFGCPGWLTITAPVTSPWGLPQEFSINVEKDGCTLSCPAAQPRPPAAKSFTWDGTYYPVTNNLTPNSACDLPACAPPGVYGATVCVGYAGQDAGLPAGAPTCQTFSFTWPPATPSEATVTTTITPTLGGG
jgi:hypothetical protein